MTITIRTRLATASLALIVIATPCAATLIWFDETNAGRPWNRFTDLAAAHARFMGSAATTVDFNDLPVGTILSDQYADSHGVTFENTAIGRLARWSGVRNEGDVFAQPLTGYDGSYMPDGDKVILKFDNDLPGTPFSILFDDPVFSVGAFVGMGIEGPIHTLQISIYDQTDNLIGQQNIQSWLWEKSSAGQNYESFFAVAADRTIISRVEILNNATKDYANGLVLDNLSFTQPPPARIALPEPATAAFLILGTGGLLLMNRKRFAA